jgi:hypothetical protein
LLAGGGNEGSTRSTALRWRTRVASTGPSRRRANRSPKLRTRRLSALWPRLEQKQTESSPQEVARKYKEPCLLPQRVINFGSGCPIPVLVQQADMKLERRSRQICMRARCVFATQAAGGRTLTTMRSRSPANASLCARRSHPRSRALSGPFAVRPASQQVHHFVLATRGMDSEPGITDNIWPRPNRP